MSLENGQRSCQQHPPTIQQVQDQIRSTCDDIIHFCTQPTGTTFYHAEQALRIHLSSLACLSFQLFLLSFHDRFDYTAWSAKGEYSSSPATARTLKTLYDAVQYWPTYLIRRE